MRIRKPVERWFPVDEDEDQAEILVVHLSPGDVADILDETTSHRYEYSQSEGEPKVVTTTDSKRDRELTIVKVIKDWKSFYDLDGQPLVCTDDNKIRAVREVEGFAEFVNDCRAKLSKDIKKEKEDQEKN